MLYLTNNAAGRRFSITSAGETALYPAAKPDGPLTTVWLDAEHGLVCVETSGKTVAEFTVPVRVTRHSWCGRSIPHDDVLLDLGLEHPADAARREAQQESPA